MNNKIEDEVKKRMVAMVENPKFMKSIMDYAQPRLEEATEELGRRIARAMFDEIKYHPRASHFLSV